MSRVFIDAILLRHSGLSGLTPAVGDEKTGKRPEKYGDEKHGRVGR